MSIQFINVTDSLYNYRDRLDSFIQKMDTEKRYFPLTLERAMKSEKVLLALDGETIVGFGGIEIKYCIPRSIIMIDRIYQGKGLSKLFMKKIHAEAEKNHHIILGVIKEGNNVSMRLDLSIGYRIVGKRDDLFYLFCPLSMRGIILFYIIKILFPFIKIMDLFRR